MNLNTLSLHGGNNDVIRDMHMRAITSCPKKYSSGFLIT